MGGTSPTRPKKQLPPRNLAISLCLEAGEVLEHYQWGDESADKEAWLVNWLMWHFTSCNWRM